jgi:hypothetical protein
MGASPARRRAVAATLLTVIAEALSAPTTAAAAGGAKAPREEPIPVLPIAIAVAHVQGKPVWDDAWIDAQIAETERLFGPAGIHIRKASSRALPERFAKLETRSDRDALASELTRGVINVMVVDTLRDVDDPVLYRRGVHWRPQKDLKKHYVIVAREASSTTLAHEIGHFFGNGHAKDMDNLMSYLRSGSSVFLSGPQEARSRIFARIYLRSKELDPSLTPPAPPPAAPVPATSSGQGGS